MKNLSATVDINAPIDVVWDVLTDTAAFPAWNPFIPSLVGTLAVGQRLEVRIEPPGARAMTFRPTVTAVEERHRLEWLGRLGVPGLFDGRHSFVLDVLPEGRTRLTQSETFTGVLVPVTGRMLSRTAEGFAAMNEALRVRAEAVATEPTPSTEERERNGR